MLYVLTYNMCSYTRSVSMVQLTYSNHVLLIKAHTMYYICIVHCILYMYSTLYIIYCQVDINNLI